MQTLANEMSCSIGYVKCGEILKSQKSFHDPYMLRCIQCKEIYLLLESFIFHLNESCKKTVEAKKIFKEQTNECGVVNEPMECEQEPPVKVENTNSKMEDPLIVIKNEADIEISIIKVEPSHIDESKNIEVESSTYFDGRRYLDQDEDESAEKSETSVNSEDECEFQDKEPEKVKIIKNPSSTDNDVSLSFSSNFMKSEENVTFLIAAFKNQPRLWNKNLPFLRDKTKRQHCLQQIAQELNTQHNISITWKQVGHVVVYLYRKYREDLRGIKETKEGVNKYIPSWFFDDLEFLKPFMENNPIVKLDSHLPDLLPDQIIQILEIYKGFPHLWNTELIEHYCKNKLIAAKQEMVQILDTKMGIKITEHILEDYLRTINNYFTRAKSNKLDKPNDKSNVGDDNTQEDYYDHMIFLYDHVGVFKCSDCERSFKSTLYLKVHKTQDHGSEPPSCSLCKKVFKTISSYTSHAKRHMEDLNHECKECGKKFLHSHDLTVHIRNHTGAKPFCCELCGAIFRKIQAFNNHHRRHIKNYLHTCHICSKGFYSKDRYNDHMNSHSNIRSHICNVCGKAFITKSALQQHDVIHDDVRRHACKLCGKTFKHKTRVNHHMRTHRIVKSETKRTLSKE